MTLPTLGLLMLQTRFPRPLGDIGHPGTFDFAVRRRVVHGATPERVVRGSDAAVLRPFVDAARVLVAEGCDAIGTSCGFLARWQHELQAALPVPVWSSALLQLAEQQALGRRCGVITIEAASLGAAHWLGVGADPATPVEGITPGSALHRTLLRDLPTLDAGRCSGAGAGRGAAAARAPSRHQRAGAGMHQPAALCPGVARGHRAAGAGRRDAAERAHGRAAVGPRGQGREVAPVLASVRSDQGRR